MAQSVFCLNGKIIVCSLLGSTPLHTAARKNNLHRVKLLLDNGADPCATDAKGQTSLYLAAKHGNPDIVMALLNSDAGKASVSIPTPEKNTALHECLKGGRIKMTECVKELVRHGADVSLCNTDCESPVDLAMRCWWSRDIIELFILQGRGMDFDRQHLLACSPLEKVIFRPKPLKPWLQRLSLLQPQEWDDSLAVLFLQMGASRDRLKNMLWYELNREEPGNRMLDTLMDSFAYLPSLYRLEISGVISGFLHDHESDGDTQLMIRVEGEFNPDEIPAGGNVASMLAELASSGISIDSVTDDLNNTGFASTHFRSRLAPASHVRQKKENYCRRQKEIPTLAHLSRSTIRRTLKADVRQVISLPIPIHVKEYILLGYQLASQGQKDGEKESVSSSSSS